MIEYLIFTICLVGSSFMSYNQGVRQGAEATIEVLRKQKVIIYSEKGDIIPNPLFKDYK